MARKAKAVPETPFMNVKDAARATGLSECYLRKQLKEHSLSAAVLRFPAGLVSAPCLCA